MRRLASDEEHRPAAQLAPPAGAIKVLRLEINGRATTIKVADADMPLLWALRDQLDLTGTKFGCGAGLCGACTVHVDGQALRACQTPVSSVEGAKITTIEGLGQTPIGRRVQAAWLAEDVAQCGYCQPGQMMSAAALLTTLPSPKSEEVDAAMAGNICRCGTYPRIRAAIARAAGHV